MNLSRSLSTIFLKKEYRCVHFSVLCDVIILTYITQHMAITPLVTAIMLDFFLIFMTIAGINYQSAPLFMPNIVVKSLLDIFLILLGCSTIDVPTTDLVDLNRNESQIPISPYTKWQRLLIAYPTLPLWLLLFILLLTVQVRFLLGQWYRTVTQSNNDTEDVSEEQKNPPSYDNCIGNNESNSSSLPSYEEALQNRNPAHLAVGNYKTSITVKCVSEQT